MRSWESLRRGVTFHLTIGGMSCAALLASGTALAAGGSPLPVPDEPPPGYSLETARKAPAVRAREAARATAEPRAAGEERRIPTPDAPVVVATRRAANKAVSAPGPVSVGARPRPEPEASPAVESTAGASAGTGSPTAARRPVLAPSTVPEATTKPPTRATPERAARPDATARRRPTRPVTDAVPRDAVRLALPTVRLVPVSDEALETALLLAGALLAAAAAAGGLAVGLVAGRLSRPA